MTKPVHVESEAEEDLRAAVAWYEQRRPGLGADLLIEAERVIHLIESFPGVGADVPRVRARYETRRIPLRRFPYLIVYRERAAESQMIAFAHTSRSPGYWRGR